MTKPSARPGLATVSARETHRAEIALAWRRAELSGLRTDDTLAGLAQREYDRGSRLLSAAAPVLDEIEDHLLDTRLCVVLADSEARIVDRRVGQASMASLLDSIRAVPGTTFDEPATGTNSIATSFELRKGVKVLGDEHYIESLRLFSCYGHPILHPITRRLEGIIDITGYAEDTTDLLAPYLLRAAREIEDRLLQGSRAAHQQLLNAYQIAATRTLDPVVVLGEGVTLANHPAIDQLAPTDFVIIRALAADVPMHQTLSTSITLDSGRYADVHCEPIARSDGVLIKLESAAPSFRSGPATGRTPARPFALPSHRDCAVQESERGELVLVSGEAGTGRTTAALAAARPGPSEVLDALSLLDRGEADWFATLEGLIDRPGAVVVENIHLLPLTTAARLRGRVSEKPPRARVVATSAPVSGLTGEHAGLAALFLTKTETAALRHNRAAVPGIVAAMLEAVRPGADLEISSGLMDRLVNHSWPGNLQELRSVIRVLAYSHESGTLTPNDLPQSYRSGSAARVRTPLEQSEYDTIVAALRECDGNKVQAARQLGIARATLYSRIRRFRIRA